LGFVFTSRNFLHDAIDVSARNVIIYRISFMIAKFKSQD
jgi:hypothetical protein